MSKKNLKEFLEEEDMGAGAVGDAAQANDTQAVIPFEYEDPTVKKPKKDKKKKVFRRDY